MPIIKNHIDFGHDFTMLPNEWVRDSRLSHRARGVLAVVMSHRDGWETSITYLVREGKEGRNAIYTAVDELVSHGYLERVEARSATGKFEGVNYEVRNPHTGNQQPLSKKPYTENPNAEKPYTDNPQQENTNYKKTITKENQPKDVGARSAPKGQRVTEDFMPAQKHIDKIRRMKPGLNLEVEHTKFINYWLSKTGKDATKLDWGRTWENWMLTAKEERTQDYKPGYQKRLEYNTHRFTQKYQPENPLNQPGSIFAIERGTE